MLLFRSLMGRALFTLAVFCAQVVSAQPDLVVIVADDLGYGDVGYTGAQDTQTPHLDALAAEGVVLDRFYVAPRCSPSRAGLLTGRYPSRMGISEAVAWADTVGLPAAEVTLPERLRGAGYETALVGKWHLGTSCAHHPTQHGFDSFVGLLGGGARYFTRATPHGIDWWRGMEPEQAEGYTTDLLADEAVARLSQRRDRPLYLHLAFTAPHVPNEARDADLARHPDLDEPRRTHVAMVERLDHAIGRVMDAVRASDRPTLVWFLSDNGAAHRHGGRNAPLRGTKGDALEGGIRVPSVVWYAPWSARRVSHPVWYLDLAPTLAAVAGAPGGGPALDGTSQAAQLAGARPTADLLDRILYTYMPGEQGGYWLAAQNATWKYLDRPTRPGPPERLFRIDRDPSERADSLSAYPDLVRQLRDGAHDFAGAVPPWATRDVSLTAPARIDLSACGGRIAPPADPSGGLVERTRRRLGHVTGRVALAACLVLALGLAVGVVVGRRLR